MGARRPVRAQVRIAVANGDLATASRSSGELTGIAAAYGTSGFVAVSAQAAGAVLLAEGKPNDALPVLLDACRRWHQLNAPYDTAQVHLLLAQAYAQMRDGDAVRRERAAAERLLQRLGAAARGRNHLPGGLTSREAEVLACVAAGRNNREVAGELVISEKTVARHLSNIFAKLGVSSRTQAAAYAFEHGLARPHG